MSSRKVFLELLQQVAATRKTHFSGLFCFPATLVSKEQTAVKSHAYRAPADEKAQKHIRCICATSKSRPKTQTRLFALLTVQPLQVESRQKNRPGVCQDSLMLLPLPAHQGVAGSLLECPFRKHGWCPERLSRHDSSEMELVDRAK